MLQYVALVYKDSSEATGTYRIVKGEVTNVNMTAITTNIENTLVSRIPADSPTLRTISSTKLRNSQHVTVLLYNRQTHPLQLISIPTAPLSRRLKPIRRAVTEHPRNLPKKATKIIRKVYPHAVPSFKRPRLVLRPESVKYCRPGDKLTASLGNRSNTYQRQK